MENMTITPAVPMSHPKMSPAAAVRPSAVYGATGLAFAGAVAGTDPQRTRIAMGSPPRGELR